MAESFIRQVGTALISSVKNKQEEILADLNIAKESAAKKAADKPQEGAKAEGGDGKGLGNLDQADAIKLQMGTAELSTISAAATGVVNAEKQAIQAIARNI